MINLLVSQGRVADRISGLIEGAAYCAHSINHLFKIKPLYIGALSKPEDDNWDAALIKAKDTLTSVAQEVEKSLQSGAMTLLLSNTCSVSLATLPKVVNHIPDVKILWIDAHTDFNTPDTTDSGYLGGMVVAATCGLWDSGYGAGVKNHNVLYLGARDIDKKEQALIENHDMQVLSPERCDIDDILTFIGNSPVWIHIDWDVLEPGYLPADYEIPNGLEPHNIAKILNSIPEEKIIGIELAEFRLLESEETNKRSVNIFHQIIDEVITKKLRHPSINAE